eukprot:4449203-Prymnesium_polylepis.1
MFTPLAEARHAVAEDGILEVPWLQLLEACKGDVAFVLGAATQVRVVDCLVDRVVDCNPDMTISACALTYTCGARRLRRESLACGLVAHSMW